jgi:hypothetical protein
MTPTAARLLSSVLATVLCSVLGLTLAPVAAAATPTVAISVSPDPAESITAQLGLTGDDSSPQNALLLRVKPAGGEACGANYEADKGQTVVGGSEGSGTGPHSVSRNWTFEASGSYLLCAWLVDNSQSGAPTVASASMTIAVRPPHIALSITVPATVQPAQLFQISTTAQSETSRQTFQYLVPNTGRGCPANASAAGSTSGEMQTDWPKQGSDWQVNGGPFTETLTESLASTGTYLVCAYVQYPNPASVPEATASASVSVVKPPPPCVVPHPSSSTSLRSFEHRLLAAHCKVGRVRYTFSSHHPRGTVIATSPKPASRHPNGTLVGLTVSRGRARRH